MHPFQTDRNGASVARELLVSWANVTPCML